MDTPNHGASMQVRLLYTDGSGGFKETVWDKPDITDDEIEVKAIMTGVCRSDVDMMLGHFPKLPLSMQGHEGLGLVTKCGANIADVKPGDYVATRGEPAYADYYNVAHKNYVPVPEASPKYILEPVACGVNLISQPLSAIIKKYSNLERKFLILGSGFLAWVAYHTLKAHGLDFEITVYGKSNSEIWGDILTQQISQRYDIVLDLSSSDLVFNKDVVNDQALIILGAQKTVTTDFSNLLWKSCSIVCPSPRAKMFYNSMCNAANLVSTGKIAVDTFWSAEYNRDTHWQQAFTDAVERVPGYNRGYIKWS